MREKWPPVHMAIERSSAGSPQRSSFENPTEIHRFVTRWVSYVVCGTYKHSIGEFGHGQTDRQTDRQTDTNKYRNPRCACMPRVNETALLHMHVADKSAVGVSPHRASTQSNHKSIHQSIFDTNRIKEVWPVPIIAADNFEPVETSTTNTSLQG